MKVLVLMADGLEEIEAITIIDVLRRAGVDVTTAATGENPVMGSHKIAIQADTGLDEVRESDFDAVILPGGMPGSANLRDSDRVISLIKTFNDDNKYVGAICAAPIALGRAGLVNGKKATCFPGFEKELAGAEYVPEPVMQDGRIITGKGPGCAIPFALKLVENFVSPEKSREIKEAMQVYWM